MHNLDIVERNEEEWRFGEVGETVDCRSDLDDTLAWVAVESKI